MRLTWAGPIKVPVLDLISLSLELLAPLLPVDSSQLCVEFLHFNFGFIDRFTLLEPVVTGNFVEFLGIHEFDVWKCA